MQHWPTHYFAPKGSKRTGLTNSGKRVRNLEACGPGGLVRLNPKFLLCALCCLLFTGAGCMSDGQPRTYNGMLVDPLDGPRHPKPSNTNSYKTFPPPKSHR